MGKLLACLVTSFSVIPAFAVNQDPKKYSQLTVYWGMYIGKEIVLSLYPWHNSHGSGIGEISSVFFPGGPQIWKTSLIDSLVQCCEINSRLKLCSGNKEVLGGRVWNIEDKRDRPILRAKRLHPQP